MSVSLVKQPVFDIQMDDLIELCDCFGSPVVVLHQSFTGSTCPFGILRISRQTQLDGKRGLHVEYQAVFPPASGPVQTPTQQRQQVFVSFQLPHF